MLFYAEQNKKCYYLLVFNGIYSVMIVWHKRVPRGLFSQKFSTIFHAKIRKF